MVVLCDTNGGRLPEEIATLTAPRSRPSACRWGSIATTIAIWRWPIRSPPSTPAPPRAGHDQRLGRTLRQRRPDLPCRQPGRQETGYQVLRPEESAATELSRTSTTWPTSTSARTNPSSAAAPSPQGRHARQRRRPRSRPATSTSTPEQVGNERRVLVSELSGRSNIMAMARRYQVQENSS